MTITQEQIAAATDRCRNVKSHLITLKRVNQKVVYGSWLDDAIKLLGEMPNMLEQLAADILTVCQREAAMIARYDAKLDALERGKVAGVSVRYRTEYTRGAGDYIQGETTIPDLISYAKQVSQGLGMSDFALRQFADMVVAALEPALKPELVVWFGSMPESNGRQNWTAILHRKGDKMAHVYGFCFARSEYQGRVQYEADRMRWIIGDMEEMPDILDYDDTLHSGYVEPVPDTPVTVSSTEQDLGALVEYFKAKAEKAYADGVKDAAKVAESYGCCHVPEEIAAAIRALLTEKDDD